ncbi:L-serine dehydratase 1 [invertebrate metagenome]|uniref:L-serine dehydratase 1 n=1 Tax=invertebrate metagenome TaxID=1711999 RepID=A0A2H9TB58_9ZZZZ
MLSIFDIFKIGIGPSSSHTIGPMWAGCRFIEELAEHEDIVNIAAVRIDLYGSLALTGKGHGTDKATLLGLSGFRPDTIDPDEADRVFDTIKAKKDLFLAGKKHIPFDHEAQLVFNNEENLPEHPNGMRIYAYDTNNIIVFYQSYLSVGGGFIVTQEELHQQQQNKTHHQKQDKTDEVTVPYAFKTATELMNLCKQQRLTIAELVMANEMSLHNDNRLLINDKLDALWNTMQQCIKRGLRMEGTLPVSGIKRRASSLHATLMANPEAMLSDHFAIMDWVTLFAMAVNEENACGGRVVTAPTNGAAGVIPAVLAYYTRFIARNSPQSIRDFLLTAAAIGMLYKMNASISGAEAGCQAEVGTACSMAAGALTAVLKGTIDQVENAAEIGMEHHLGMTCDPIAGLVQIPCIERNGMAAIKAITASRLARRGDGNHAVSLDSCIETMYQTGLDIQSKYRETSLGGLAKYARHHHTGISSGTKDSDYPETVCN